MKYVHIIGGGTVFHIRPHLALSAPAYGNTAHELEQLCKREFDANYSTMLHLTRMAGGSYDLETNEHVGFLLERLVDDRETRVVFMPVALCDFQGHVLEPYNDTDGRVAHRQLPSGKKHPRLKTADGQHLLNMTPAPKIISGIRSKRKDIFLVGFKTTSGAAPQEQFYAGLRLLKQSSCNLVLANDTHTHLNMVITPEQAAYSVTIDREQALKHLVSMAAARSTLHFTRSTVEEGEPVPWSSSQIPVVTRKVVEGFIKHGAYRPFLGKTVGHFAIKLGAKDFLTSIRGSDYNNIDAVGMVYTQATGDDQVVSYGAKPSVGGQSQRKIFATVPDVDSIAHAHLKQRPESKVPVRSQRDFECGSHECGENTALGLQKFGKIWAVMLDKHGPNIVFNSKEVTAEEVLSFVDQNFYFDHHTSEVEW